MPSSLIVQVVRVSDGLDRYRAEVEKDDSRVETMRNFWSGYSITGLVSYALRHIQVLHRNILLWRTR